MTESTLESEHLRHLGRVEAEDVAQDEDGELSGRKDLQSGDEGQGDGFALLVAGRRLEEGVRKGLEPDDLAVAGRLWWFDLGDVPFLGRSSVGRATRVEAPVGGDAVEPGSQRRAFRESAEAPPGGQQRVLNGVLGILEGTEHPVAVHQ